MIHIQSLDRKADGGPDGHVLVTNGRTLFAIIEAVWHILKGLGSDHARALLCQPLIDMKPRSDFRCVLWRSFMALVGQAPGSLSRWRSRLCLVRSSTWRGWRWARTPTDAATGCTGFGEVMAAFFDTNHRLHGPAAMFTIPTLRFWIL